MFLTLKNISKHFSNPGGTTRREVLKGINLEIEQGEKIAIVGPSGCGKTTLLNLIGTLDKPDSGKILFNGNDLSDLSQKDLLNFRNQELGFIFQLHHLLPQCTLWENVLIPSLPNKQHKKEIANRAESLLKKTAIWERRFQVPGELSGGECQRAAVVRSLINQPSLLLADEPTGALDQENALQLIELLIDLNQEQNTSMIIVTHSMELAKKMDNVYYLRNGQLEMGSN